MSQHRDVAPGIHRAVDAYTNWYVIEDGGLTIVDAGVPTSWDTLQSLLSEMGSSLRDVRALVLTHGHFDHIGIAERLRREADVEVWVHENDVPLTRHPTQYAHERSPLRYLRNPAFRPVFWAFMRARAFFPPAIGRVRRFGDGDRLPVPGEPAVVAAPGHTLGQCMLSMPARRAVITGDALVTLDPYTGRGGPHIVAGGATADSERALASLSLLAGLEPMCCCRAMASRGVAARPRPLVERWPEALRDIPIRSHREDRLMNVNPIEVQKHLSGVDYPASKDDLVECAQQNGADDDIVRALSQLPPDEYDGPDTVMERLAG